MGRVSTKNKSTHPGPGQQIIEETREKVDEDLAQAVLDLHKARSERVSWQAKEVAAEDKCAELFEARQKLYSVDPNTGLRASYSPPKSGRAKVKVELIETESGDVDEAAE